MGMPFYMGSVLTTSTHAWVVVHAEWIDKIIKFERQTGTARADSERVERAGSQRSAHRAGPPAVRSGQSMHSRGFQVKFFDDI